MQLFLSAVAELTEGEALHTVADPPDPAEGDGQEEAPEAAGEALELALGDEGLAVA